MQQLWYCQPHLHTLLGTWLGQSQLRHEVQQDGLRLHLYRPDSRRSSEGEKKVRPPAAPRGTMLIFATGSYSGMRAPISACPACAGFATLQLTMIMDAQVPSGTAQHGCGHSWYPMPIMPQKRLC